jgi:bacterioferritin
MDKQEIIEMLSKDMMGEQQAIIQYLYHAYGMEEGTIPAEVEAISREEMRHWDWLADAIVELGGDPTIERDPVDFSPASAKAQLLKDVGLEQIAIDQYRAHIEAIDDEYIRLILGRILHDELVHKGQFNELAEAAREEMTTTEESEEAAAGPEGPAERLAAILNQGVRHEYAVTLQYLFHSYMTEDKELAEELHTTAINEMQHMGWLSEQLSERGGDPEMEHGDLVLGRDMVRNLKADIAVEQEVTRDYTEHLSELEDPELIELVERIRDHEIYHDALFKHLLGETLEKLAAEKEEAVPCEPPQEAEEKPAGPPSPPSIGSLRQCD